jgi:hypothetical protein
VIGLDPISTVPKGGTTQRPKLTQLSLFGGQNHFGPSKDFATKIIPKLCRNWRAHKISETMQNKQAWYFIGQNSYFSGNPQNQALGIGGKPLMCMGVPSWFL